MYCEHGTLGPCLPCETSRREAIEKRMNAARAVINAARFIRAVLVQQYQEDTPAVRQFDLLLADYDSEGPHGR